MIRYITKEDYPLIKSWFDKFENWPMPLETSLPPIGAMTDFAAGWLYYTNSDIAIIEFIIADREYRGDDRNKGIEEIINLLNETAKKDGYRLIFAWIKHKGLKQKYVNKGFIEAGECTELIKIL